MVEQLKPIVTELALTDALDQLLNLIEVAAGPTCEPARGDHHRRNRVGKADLHRHSQTWAFHVAAGGPGYSRAQIVRRVWNEGLRDYDTPYRSGDAV